MDYRFHWRQRRLERRRQRLLTVPLGLLLGLLLYLILQGVSHETVVWTHQGPIRCTPHFAVGAASLYATWPDGHLEALRLADGELHGDGPLLSQPEPFNGSPVYSNQVVYFASDLGVVRAVRSTTGALIWELETGSAIRGQPLLDGPRLYFGNDAGSVYCLVAAEGSQAWRTDLQAAVAGAVARVGEVLVAATTDGTVYGLHAGDGHLLWQQPLGEPVFAPVTSADPLCVVGTDLGTAYLLETGTGEVVQSYQTRGMIRASAAVSPTAICFGSTDGWLRVVSRDGKTPLWSYHLGGPVSIGPIFAEGHFYAASERRLVAMHPDTGRVVHVWRYPSLAGSLVPSSGFVYVGSNDGLIIALAQPG